LNGQGTRNSARYYLAALAALCCRHGPANAASADEEDERDRRVANIFLAVCFVLIVGGGIWLVNAMVAQRDLDNCVAQGRRNCAPIEPPAR
jgi:hypothetical protein